MKHIYFVASILLIAFLTSCQSDAKDNTQISENSGITTNNNSPTPTPVANVTSDNTKSSTTAKQDTSKTPKSDTSTEAASQEEAEDAHPYRNIGVGSIKSACDLITEAEIRKKIPGFANVQELKMMPRNSPDNHASACECRAINENIAFVLGYRKNPTNLQYIDQIIAEGEVREYAANIPPYEPVQGLGQKAAFNRKHGYMKWVGENGVLVYGYVFPTTPQTIGLYEKVLFRLAHDIDDRFHGR